MLLVRYGGLVGMVRYGTYYRALLRHYLSSWSEGLIGWAGDTKFGQNTTVLADQKLNIDTALL